MDGELWSVIQEHLDRYGVREAALARRMGTSPQTINTWKMHGLKRLPERWLLEAVARETGTPYSNVLHAALLDTGYLSDGAVTGEPAPSPEQERSGVHPSQPQAGDTSQVAARPAHGPSRSRVAGSAGTRRRGSR